MIWYVKCVMCGHLLSIIMVPKFVKPVLFTIKSFCSEVCSIIPYLKMAVSCVNFLQINRHCVM